ncbi:hypothetical protein CEH05_20600 (plasmid) [Halobacillus halophilus]|nr:hypothetical protein CEH05_20600 [Halobacillus halophilus]
MKLDYSPVVNVKKVKPKENLEDFFLLKLMKMTLRGRRIQTLRAFLKKDDFRHVQGFQ